MNHTPVLLEEVVALLNPAPGRTLVDATLGGGGHSEALLGRGAAVLALDRDANAIAAAQTRFAPLGDRFRAVHAPFGEIADVVAQYAPGGVDGVLADLGVSSLQLDDPARGLSFRHAGPLDMRLDASAGEALLAKLARVDAGELEHIIREYGEDRKARAIARSILAMRDAGDLQTTADLARAVLRAVGEAGRDAAIHPATRTFQALRIWVNDELTQLDLFLNTVWSTVRAQGRVAVISYHSLEDRRVKHAFRAAEGLDKVAVLTKKPMTPSDAEATANPRSRSAKLRVAEKL